MPIQPIIPAQQNHQPQAVSLEQAVTILADATRAGLAALAGSDPQVRMLTTVGFLYRLCALPPQALPADREVVARLVESVASAVRQGKRPGQPS